MSIQFSFHMKILNLQFFVLRLFLQERKWFPFIGLSKNYPRSKLRRVKIRLSILVSEIISKNRGFRVYSLSWQLRMNDILLQMHHLNQYFPNNQNQHNDFNRFSKLKSISFIWIDFENDPKDFSACSIVINSGNG